MANVAFIVEGSADFKFLKDFVFVRFSVELTREDFIIVGGKAESLHKVKTQILKSVEIGKRNVLIFDSDDGYQGTLTNILTTLNNEGLLINDIFLFPKNQLDTSGNLETLLREIMSSTGQGVLPCIDAYSDCIAQLNRSELRKIDNKGKIFIYIDSFVDGGNPKDEQRSYQNTSLWDLNSIHLESLVKFLSPYFVNL